MLPLTTLKSRVDSFAELCEPDFVYRGAASRELTFATVCVQALLGDPLAPDRMGLKFQDEQGTEQLHLFTTWSRQQLLSHMGAREKWFAPVSLGQQAIELNARRHTLEGHMLRTMRTYDYETVRLVRGLVSSKYGDIPDTSIMEALTTIMPEGMAIARHSGKTDRAFYAYVVVRDPIEIPQTGFRAFPGMVVKNSEVGFTSLWVLPMLYSPGTGACVLEQYDVLRRIHRGKPGELEVQFREALDRLKDVWSTAEERLHALHRIKFADEDAAIEKMKGLILRVGGPKMLAWRCEQAYRAAQHPAHTGHTIFTTILDRVASEQDKDTAHTAAGVAGAVLLKLKG
jgi:hypothetical protein